MVSPQLVGTVQILTGLGALAFLKPAWENRDKPGSRSFGLFTVAVAAYAIASGTDLLTASTTASIALAKTVVSAGVLVGVAWLFLALEVTDVTVVNRRHVAVFGGYVLAAWLVTWVNPGSIVVGEAYELIGTQFDADYQVGFWALLGIAYVNVLVGTALLAVASARSTGIRRRQTGLLALAIAPPFVMSVLNATILAGGTVGYDYTVFGWAMTLVTFAVALYSGRFLDITAIARRTAMGEMRDAMVTLDEQNRVVDANSAARETFGIGRDYVGMPAAEFFEPVPREMRSRLADTADTDTEVAVSLDGEKRHFSLSVSPVGERVESGRVFVFRDITARKQRERRLQRQNERLDTFAGSVSHDLRNPLNVAKGYLDVAREADGEEAYERIEEALDRMETMIDELLAMARADTIVEDPEAVRLERVVRNSWEMTDLDGATLEVTAPETASVHCDPELLRHVFENLFRNAADHNERPVSITVGTLDGDRSGFYVEDDGGGIPPGEREDVFEHGYSRAESGTGFGLSIVHTLARAHDWEVTVTDGTEGGARFEFVT